MKTKDLRCQFKDIGASGRFEGYAAIFGNVDEGKDRIQPGAFKEIVTNGSGRVLTLYMHGFKDPIGLAAVAQDSKGLAFDAQLELGDALAQRAHTLMKAGILDGMSIGYDSIESTFDKDGVRDLTAVKLYEISPVTFGMNPLARIEGVKQAGQIITIREFEDFLRDVGGFSHRQARAIASDGFKALQTARDEPDATARIAALISERFTL